MAPNPSAALRVVLAASLAAVTLSPAVVFADTPATEPGVGFVILQVGDVVPTYNAIVLRTKDLTGLKAGGEKEVDAIIPSQMERQGTLTAHTYKLIGKAEKVKVKLIEEARSLQSGRWQLTRAGKVVAGKDGKPATFEGCVPNGDRRCINGIAGVARNFIIVASAPTSPAPLPVPPVGSPAPDADFAGPFPWRSAPINDTANGVEHRKCKKAECACTGDSCKGKRVNLYAVTKADKADGTVKFTMTLDADNYLTHAGEKWNMCWNSGSRASVPVATMAGFPDSKFLRDATYWVKGGNAGADFKGVKKAEFSWAGTEPAKPKDMSAECTYGGSPETGTPPTPDPVAGKLEDLLGTDKGALALARLAQKVWTGTPTFDETLAAALKNPDKAKGRAEFLGKAQEQALADIGKSAGVLKADPPLKTDFKEAYCKPSAGPAPAAAQTATNAMGQAERQRTDQNTADGRSMPAVAAGSGSAFAGLCSLLDETPASQPPSAGPAPRVPDITNGAPAPTPDVEKPSTAAEDAKKKKDLQRMAIGGAGGAIVLGVFGFIFGGPIGALAMGALGFGIMAGVTYLNNNPIDK